ncbi:hypothetical protein [Streptomyces sp. NPDC059092]|uniref:hypothetical protein n=1 Tax=Streptomyces sp. NPDC059092 TaxID=3346725 RepID=UPI00367B3002
MADAQFSDAAKRVHTASHPMASAGYGKRSVAGQPGRSSDDFALLPGREAAVAGFIDRLPDGADISVKALAKVMEYGQCALRTALNFLERAGHLFRRRELVVGPAGGRWVTRTWFSRAARDGGSWTAQLSGDASESGPGGIEAPGTVVTAPGAVVTAPGAAAPGAAPGAGAAVAAAPVTAAPGAGAAVVSRPARLPERSRGYSVLASVGRRCPALSLSAADCAALEPLVAEWFVRGAGEEDVVRALTDGLPTPVHHPAGLVRSRLVAKLPPELADPPPVSGPPVTVVECGTCRAPARAEALRDGECRVCRGEAAPVRLPAALPPERVRARAAEVRSAAAAGG